MLSCKIPVPPAEMNTARRTHKWGTNTRRAPWGINNLGEQYTRLIFICNDCGREYQGLPVYLPDPLSLPNVPGRV